MTRLRPAFASLGSPGAGLARLAALAARHGWQGVELRAAEDELLHTGLSARQAEATRRGLKDAGLRVVAVDTYVRLCAPSSGSDGQLDALLAHLDLAQRIGAPAIRVFMNDTPDGTGGGEERALLRLSRAMSRAADAGVRVLIETHDSHARAAALARFLTRLDGELPGHGCGALWDTAHTWAHGERPTDSLALLRPWLGHVQVKDVRSAEHPVPVPLGTGGYPIHALAAALTATAAGCAPVFTGWVCLEWERRWHPELPPLDEALTAARTWTAPLFTACPEAPTA